MVRRTVVDLSLVDSKLGGIYLVQGRGNAYVLKRDRVIVDAGAEGDLDALEILPPVEFLLVTHDHPCHTGGLERLWQAYFPRVFCPEASAEKLVNEFGIDSSQIDPLRGNETLDLGDLVFRVVPCPGHTPDSVAFYETRTSFLFSGDTVVEEKNCAITPKEANLGEWAESVRFLSTLKISILLPGHGPVRDKGVINFLVNSYAYIQGLVEDDPSRGAIAGGIQFADLGMMKEAIRLFDQVLEENPENPGAVFSKGLALLKMSRFKEAVNCFDLALKVVPDFKEAANAKALAQSAAKGVMPPRGSRGR